MHVAGKKKYTSGQFLASDNSYLAQVAKMCEFPSEAAFVSNLGAFSADQEKRI